MDDETLIASLVQELKDVPGVMGIVLGGSRARGTHTLSSDIDMALYYQPEAPLAIETLRALAEKVDDAHRREAVTEIGGWGPRINGGGWLTVRGTPVDFLYRDLQMVTASIDVCHAGQVDIAYQPGHPHGFTTAVYMAEIALCRILWDPAGIIAALKTQTVPYPRALQQAIIKRFFWEARFSLEVASKGVHRNDVSYVAGCCFRSVSCLMQTVFALNDCYWMNEKGAVALAKTFPLHPAELETRIAEAFSNLVPDPLPLTKAIQVLENLVQETEELLVHAQETV